MKQIHVIKSPTGLEPSRLETQAGVDDLILYRLSGSGRSLAGGAMSSWLPAAHHLSYGRESGGADGSYGI